MTKRERKYHNRTTKTVAKYKIVEKKVGGNMYMRTLQRVW
jgi:hypothetical protein